MTVWTDEKIEQMRQMALQGYSSSQMGAVLGCSRNAVIGKMHRLRFAFSKPKLAETEGKAKPSMPRINKSEEPSVKIPKIRLKSRPRTAAPRKAGKECSIVDVTGCRWPVRDDPHVIGRYWFCNAELHDARYCEHHSRESGASYSADLIRKTARDAFKAYKRAA